MQMEYIEVINAATTHDRAFVDGKYFTEGLEGRERVEFDSWMEKTGRPIQIRWSIWEMEKKEHKKIYETITQYIEGVGDRITFVQKIDLCDQFYIKLSLCHLDKKKSSNSLAINILKFREDLMHELEGIEKAKAYMAYVEFLSENKISAFNLFTDIIPKIRDTLDKRGKAAVDAWMEAKGKAIEEKWRR